MHIYLPIIEIKRKKLFQLFHKIIIIRFNLYII